MFDILRDDRGLVAEDVKGIILLIIIAFLISLLVAFFANFSIDVLALSSVGSNAMSDFIIETATDAYLYIGDIFRWDYQVSGFIWDTIETHDPNNSYVVWSNFSSWLVGLVLIYPAYLVLRFVYGTVLKWFT